MDDNFNAIFSLIKIFLYSKILSKKLFLSLLLIFLYSIKKSPDVIDMSLSWIRHELFPSRFISLKPSLHFLEYFTVHLCTYMQLLVYT